MPLPTLSPQKSFTDLGEREILALAITLEEEDGRIYRDDAEGLRAEYPASAAVFERMAEEDSRHRPFVLQVIQPGLAGLMDGSVSTLAPVFAAPAPPAAAGRRSWSGSRPRLAPASRWASPRRSSMAAASLAAAIPGSAGWSPRP